MYRADIAYSLRHVSGNARDCDAVLELRREHPLLYESREEEDHRQNHDEQQRETNVPDRDHGEDGYDPAGVREHTDDAGREQCLDRVDVPDEPRSDGYAMSGGLSGGVPYILCAEEAYEKYGVSELPKVRDYGFSGLHFIDELTAVEVMPCCHPEHPVNRTEMGDIDLWLVSDEDMDGVVKALRDADEEYRTLKHLQYEFMDKHEKVGEDVYRVTYSDGTVITVNYREGGYTVEKC